MADVNYAEEVVSTKVSFFVTDSASSLVLAQLSLCSSVALTENLGVFMVCFSRPVTGVQLRPIPPAA